MCTMYSVQRIVYFIHCTMYNIQCTMYRVQCTVYSVQCTWVKWFDNVIIIYDGIHSTRIILLGVRCDQIVEGAKRYEGSTPAEVIGM